MALRRRRYRLGAVARHGGGYGRKSHGRTFNVSVDVIRDIGASTAHQYNSIACVTKRGRARRRGYFTTRCGQGVGRTPTSAAKKALRKLAVILK